MVSTNVARRADPVGVGGRGAGDAGEQHRQRDDDDDGGGEDHGCARSPPAAARSAARRPAARAWPATPTGASAAAARRRAARPTGAAAPRRPRRRRPGPRPGASAARRSSSRQRPEDGHARDAVRHLRAQGRAQQQPRRPRPSGGEDDRGQGQRGGQQVQVRAEDPDAEDDRVGGPEHVHAARPRRGSRAARSSSHRTSSQAATTTTWPTHTVCRRLSPPSQRGPGLDEGRERAVDARRPRPGRLDRAGHRVRAAVPGHRRHDVRVAALGRDPPVRRVVGVVGGPERRGQQRQRRQRQRPAPARGNARPLPAAAQSGQAREDGRDRRAGTPSRGPR